jgi:hypothetical protein
VNDLNAFFALLDEARARMEMGGADPNNIRPYGGGPGNEYTLTQYMSDLGAGKMKEVSVRTKETTVTVPTDTMYGCTGLFGLCGPDDVIGMSMTDDPLSEWLGWFPDTVCERFIKGLTYMDQEGTAAGSTVGYVYGDSCDDPPTSEKGVVEFPQGDFGTLHGCGEGVKLTDIGKRKCDKQPTYTLPVNGVPIRIDNDLVLERLSAAEMVKHEHAREVITGDNTVTGQFDGLAQLVNTGYTDIKGNLQPILDSVVVDWQNDTLTGAVNGHGSIITKIRDIWRKIMLRIRWSSLGLPREGDAVLVMPSWMAWAVLDEFAYWSFYAGQQYNEVMRSQSEMRAFRDAISRGMYGGGYVTVDGFNIHIIPHDWMAIDQSAPNFCTDIYLLTRQLGTRRILYGQYMPVEMGQRAVNSDAGYPYFGVMPLKGGRAVTWLKTDNTCIKPCLEVRPRLRLDAPWAEAVINNVCIPQQFNPMSVDPQSDYWFGDDPIAAEAITQYWYQNDTGWFH